MEIKEIRVTRLKQFIDAEGGAAKVSKKFNVDASYLSQIINGHASFAEKSARKLEATFNMPANSFDVLAVDYNKSEKLKQLNKAAQNLPEWAIDEAIADALKKAELIERVRSEKNGTENK